MQTFPFVEKQKVEFKDLQKIRTGDKGFAISPLHVLPLQMHKEVKSMLAMTIKHALLSLIN